MTNPQSQFQPLLPKLKNAVPAGEAAGQWNFAGPAMFNQIARDLDYDVPPNTQINSVPSPWARAMQIQSAILDPNYPTRDGLLQQYQGLLATLALCEIKKLRIEANEVDLIAERIENEFAQSLWNLRPSDQDNLLTFTPPEGPWKNLYLFSVDSGVIGFTSPATLVVPASQLSPVLSQRIPWIGTATGTNQVGTNIFLDPTPFLNPLEKQGFAGWLVNLANAVLSCGSPNQTLIGAVAKVLQDFANQLGGARQTGAALQTTGQPFGIPIAPSPLTAISQPVQPQVQASNVQVRTSAIRKVEKPLYLIDQEILPRILGRSAQDIYVHGATTLASFRREDIPTSQGVFLYTGELFAPEVYYFKQPGAFPGSWLTQKFEASELSILLPLNELLRNYFSSRELQQSVDLESCQTPEGPGVRVTLTLSVSGFDQPTQVKVFKDFPLKAENELSGDVPALALWPSVMPGDWTEYFLFIEDSEEGSVGFAVDEPTPGSMPSTIKDATARFKVWRCDRYPDVLEAVDRDHRFLGLLPLTLPKPDPGAAQTWNVGVDFGTSFTNIHLRSAGRPQRLQLKTNVFPITQIPAATADRFYREYFIPNRLIPEGNNPPMSTMLTIKGWQEENNVIPKLIDQARLYVPILTGAAAGDHIKSNIKWDFPQYQRPFLAELTRMIAAQAASEGVRTIRWHVSYPSAFSRADLAFYKTTWERVLEELNQVTGQTHTMDVTDTAYKTESIAFAQYFADVMERNLVHTTCVDIGGGTSDLSIWQEMALVHQASVPFAGRELFHNLLQPNLAYLNDIFALKDSDATSLREILSNSSNFNAALDVYLRSNDRQILENINASSRNPRIEQFRTLLTFGFAGLYFYIGQLLRYLSEEKKLLRHQVTPVLLGGNGSRFLNWLALGGVFRSDTEPNLLLSKVMATAANFESSQHEDTIPSDAPKQEAAGGLVVSETRLTGLVNSGEAILLGMPCEINGKQFAASDLLIVDSEISQIESFRINDFSIMEQFIHSFNQAIRDLAITSIQPLRDFRTNKPLELSSALKDKLDREIIMSCHRKLGEIDKFEPEPTFLIAHKSFLKILAKEWAEAS
jgi:hypothetical protein